MFIPFEHARDQNAFYDKKLYELVTDDKDGVTITRYIKVIDEQAAKLANSLFYAIEIDEEKSDENIEILYTD